MDTLQDKQETDAFLLDGSIAEDTPPVAVRLRADDGGHRGGRGHQEQQGEGEEEEEGGRAGSTLSPEAGNTDPVREGGRAGQG